MTIHNRSRSTVTVLLGVCLSGCSAFYPELPVVESVDLEQYAGK